MAGRLCSEVSDALDLGVLRYSNVWEDHSVLEAALDVKPDDDVLSITSSGDNALNLLLAGEPRSLTAIDMSRVQSAVLELKLAAIRHVPSHHDFLTLLGINGPPERRLDLYASLKPHLPTSCSSYFDSDLAVIENGVVSSGRLAKFLATYTNDYLYEIVSRSQIDSLFDAKDLEEQREKFGSFPLDKLKQSYLNYFTFDRLAAKGRDHAQMKYIGDFNISEFLWSRLVTVIRTIPIHNNFYLSWFLRGPAVKTHAVPPYLDEKNFHRLHSLVDRVSVVTDSLESHLQRCSNHTTFSKANLSDIFEYMDEGNCHALFHLLAAKCRPGGRLAYWNLFTPRSPPDELLEKQKLRSLPEMGSLLHSRDRVFFYSSFHVVEAQ